MKSLQKFRYPVADMNIYRECLKLDSIGIDSSRAQNFDAMAGNLSSYGYVGADF